jgi:excisionase family DNA binding protein
VDTSILVPSRHRKKTGLRVFPDVPRVDLGALPPTPEPAGDVLTLAQAAQLCQVGTGTVLRWVRENGLPCRGEGRIRRFSRAAVLAWLGRMRDG